MKAETIQALQQVKTVKEYLTALQTLFDCSECKPGKLVKSTLVYNLTKDITEVSPVLLEKLKNEALETVNLFDFAEVVKNCPFLPTELNERGRAKVISTTEIILKLTNLKEK